ncbi:oligopeptide transport system ATP-binding protein [Rhizobiales bacterium GAS191]|nr:oligopeptide transport system ATP-binding protein [Rhizobiales bacterium GAS191]
MTTADAAPILEPRTSDGALLAARLASCHFPVSAGSRLFGAHRVLKAVDTVSLALSPGEIVALVGESGSGKSTLGRLLLGLTPPTHGSVTYRGQDIAALTGEPWRRFRREVQVVFQDTGTSLNPRRPVGDAIAMPLRYNLGLAPRQASNEIDALLDQVGLAPSTFRHRLPHELSGGQRQRIGLARALASQPRVIIADEPVSALDVSVRAQMLSLMRALSRDRGVSLLVITHDLGVVRAIADRVLVMYLGRIVEEGEAAEMIAHPRHPYTSALLAATPIADPARRGSRQRTALRGDPPSVTDLPSGCRFRTRCPHAAPLCAEREPMLARVSDKTFAACHFPLETVPM